MPAKLYSLSLSHPSQAARLMLEHKGLEHRVVELLAGVHPLQVRAAGFRGGTVPALKLDGRRVQGSLQISRALEQPDPPLFPAEQRAAVEQAEAWGERELQPVPRRLFRWAVSHDPELRRWLAGEVLRLPAPGLMALGYAPLSRAFARMAGASDARVRADIAELARNLDRVDELIAARTIGADEPNAADFQIATTVRVLMAFEDLRDRVEGRPAGDLAMRVLPRFPGPIPRALPQDWL
ncbi:MAG: glutathione S-transferase family protein [Solirubrobacterales bacterium]